MCHCVCRWSCCFGLIFYSQCLVLFWLSLLVYDRRSLLDCQHCVGSWAAFEHGGVKTLPPFPADTSADLFPVHVHPSRWKCSHRRSRHTKRELKQASTSARSHRGAIMFRLFLFWVLVSDGRFPWSAQLSRIMIKPWFKDCHSDHSMSDNSTLLKPLLICNFIDVPNFTPLFSFLLYFSLFCCK